MGYSDGVVLKCVNSGLCVVTTAHYCTREVRSSAGSRAIRAEHPGGRLFAMRSPGGFMRYILAWALGVPFSVVALWYIVAHAGC